MEILERMTSMKRMYMYMLFLCGLLLAGCAGREREEGTWRGVQAGMGDLTALTERTEYYDIVSEGEDIFYLGMGYTNPGKAFMQGGAVLLGTQFYAGEAIQLWFQASGIYLYHGDGSRELLLQGVSAAYILFNNVSGWNWHLTQEGDFYCWHGANYSINASRPIADENKIEAAFAKISASGEIVYEKELDIGVSVEDFCQLSDGRCWLLLRNDMEQTRTLAELDPATGSFSEEDKVQMISPVFGSQYLGTAGGALAVFNNDLRSGKEIMELNPADKTASGILSFTGTTYVMYHAGMSMQDFRVLEDGSVEILWMDSVSREGGILERLRMAKVEKTPIVVRGIFQSDSWILDLASKFNQQSSRYHVVIEDCGAGNDAEDFARLTSIQLAAGKGPDIIQAGFMQDYVAGILEKGVLEDLKPYMEKSGIREEDYFPLVFSTWRDGGHIYGINPKMIIHSYKIDEDILGGREEPDMETLVDSLLKWEGNAVYLSGRNSRDVLEMFLAGTETLWGMIDWERGSCDFSGELFAHMLEAAKRYGDDGRKGQLPSIIEGRIFYTPIKYDSAAEREREGKVTCGVMFDDGCHGAVYSRWTMALNSNSANKEGAWEFLCFLLGDEAQNQDTPVSREAFERWLERQRERVADGKKVVYITETGDKDKTTYEETNTE